MRSRGAKWPRSPFIGTTKNGENIIKNDDTSINENQSIKRVGLFGFSTLGSLHSHNDGILLIGGEDRTNRIVDRNSCFLIDAINNRVILSRKDRLPSPADSNDSSIGIRSKPSILPQNSEKRRQFCVIRNPSDCGRSLVGGGL